jgi:hypothetical protein
VSGTIELPEEPGLSLEVEVFRIAISTGDVFAVVATVSSNDGETSTVEFFAAHTGALMPTAVLRDGRAELATDQATIAVVFVRDQLSRRYTTLFPVASGWMSVTEVLDTAVAQSRVDSASAVEGTTKITLETERVPVEQVPREQVPGQSLPDETIPMIDGDGLGAIGTFIDGYQIPCEGAWITIVASENSERVGPALARSPGARAMRNADACPSLNPTFMTGSSAGQDIYVVFYGPFALLDEARGKCNELGYRSMNDCFVAPLTFDAGDRSLRFGPL